MYVVDFFQKVVRKSNASVMIYMIINALLIVFLFSSGFSDLGGIAAGLVAYGLSLAIALSPIGEWILRLQVGAKPIDQQAYLQRLMPLFDEVYAKAKIQDPTLPNDIKLFINKDMSRNAFATGRKTICLTQGLLEHSDEEIKGVLAHEFGHLSNRDTDLILLITVGNMIVTAFFIFYRWFFLVAGFMAGMMYRSLSTIIITFFVDVILVAMMTLWTKIGIMLVMHSSRGNEFEADNFAARLGYASPLIDVLDHPDFTESTQKGIVATLMASHPEPNQRIAKLQENFKLKTVS